MGRSITPTYRLEVTVNVGHWTHQAWRVTGPGGYGKPTSANLLRWVDSVERSTKLGGANQHLGATTILTARIVRQSTGDVVCAYEASHATVVAAEQAVTA